MILRGTVYPRCICPRGHMVLGPHVLSPPRTGSPGRHVEGGTFETTTTAILSWGPYTNYGALLFHVHYNADIRATPTFDYIRIATR